jgi:hypothetical protein
MAFPVKSNSARACMSVRAVGGNSPGQKQKGLVVTPMPGQRGESTQGYTYRFISAEATPVLRAQTPLWAKRLCPSAMITIAITITNRENELETTQTHQVRKRRFPVLLVMALLLLLAAGAVALVSLFNQSLVTADQKHDHDGDGQSDH